MKKQILLTVVLGIITLFSYTPADAQIVEPVTADIPFEFYVGDKKMPAGEYVFERVSSTSLNGFVWLRRKDGKVMTIMMPAPTTIKRKGEVAFIFNSYGDARYLSEIRNGFAEIGGKLRRGKTEIELARRFDRSKPETISLDASGEQKSETAKGSSN